MKRLMLFLAVAGILSGVLTGCTGTSMMVQPDLQVPQGKYSGQCGKVGVRELASDQVYPPAGNLTPGFADMLRVSGLAESVYYPTRPDDQVDYLLDTKFNVRFDPHMGSNLVKSFFTGLTLFLLEPAFWYNYDYQLQGEVTIYQSAVRTAQVNAGTMAGMELKFLSLGDVAKLEGETLQQAKQSLYVQLVDELAKSCKQQ